MTIAIDHTHDVAKTSWVASANTDTTDFPIQNLALGSFQPAKGDARIGVESVGKPWAQAQLRWSVRGNPNVSVRPKT